IEAVLALADQTNKYLNDEKPWTVFKEGKTAQGEAVLLTALEIMRRGALYIYPVTPSLAGEIWYQLGYDTRIEDLGTVEAALFELIPTGQAIRTRGPIFKRIEEAEVPA